jgi:hypothetical protein
MPVIANIVIARSILHSPVVLEMRHMDCLLCLWDKKRLEIEISLGSR